MAHSIDFVIRKRIETSNGFYEGIEKERERGTRQVIEVPLLSFSFYFYFFFIRCGWEATIVFKRGDETSVLF